MAVKYSDKEDKTLSAAEPAVTYNANYGHHTSEKDKFSRERVMADTVSVDAYFDELLSQPRIDWVIAQ